MRPVLALIPLAALTALAACTDEPRAAPASTAPAATVIGDPVNCIPLHQIQNTVVHDDRTIDFEMSGRKVYRNTLPGRCSGLGFEESFSYETSQSTLCSTDIIHVLYRSGGAFREGSACGLGQFVPVEISKADGK